MTERYASEPTTTPGVVGSPLPGNGWGLGFVVQTLLRGRWWLIGMPLVMALVVLAYLAVAKPTYEATSSVIIEHPALQAQRDDVRSLGPAPDVLVEVELLKSFDMARQVAQAMVEGIALGRLDT